MEDKITSLVVMDSIDTADNDYHIFTQKELFVEALQDFRRQGKLCDVILNVEDQSFSAHRIVLAAAIPYFNAMFSHDMTESRVQEITMKEIEPQALENLINFAYSGSVKIDKQNVQGLMISASFLQLTQVRDACANFLERKFNPHNVLGIRQFADSLSCTKLVAQAEKYIQYYFSKVSQSKEFIDLSYDNLVDFINRDELYVPSEEQIFEACMQWIKFDKKKRSNLLPQILAQVRLPLLSPQFLVDRVATEELIRTSHQCRDLVDEANSFHLMPERRALAQSFRTRPRCYDYVIGHIYVVGGLSKTGDLISTVEIYDPVTTNDWRIGEAMSIPHSRGSVAVLGGKLYVLGGLAETGVLETVEVYDPKTQKWSQGNTMRSSRLGFGVAALEEQIYVCGGTDGFKSLSAVECYCPKNDTWIAVAPMIENRKEFGMAVLGGNMYAVGGEGKDEGSIYSFFTFDSVERYDPVSNTWTKVKSMLNRRCRLGVATLNGKLYACGGSDGNSALKSAEMYDPGTDIWTPVTPMNVERSLVALIANVGKLWAIGGNDGTSSISTVEVYDPSTQIWSFVAPMVCHEGCVGAGVIPNQ